MLPPLPGVSDLIGQLAGNAANSVFSGLVGWMARGLAVLIEWVWTTLDTATTPRLTESWFAHDLAGPIGLVAVAVTIAMMLASGIQAALAGRPEQIFDSFKHGAWSIAASVLCVTLMTYLLGLVDAVSNGVWMTARGDMQHLLEGVIAVMQASTLSAMGFLAVLLLLLMYLALIGLAVALAMRNALIYMTAALAPIVFGSSVLPMMRDSSRKLVHLAVSLIVSKLAIVITLVLAVKLMANAGSLSPSGNALSDGVAALGTLFAGIVCFAVASITPLVLYKLMPTVEGAVVGAGVAGGWSRGAMTGMYGMSSAKNLGSGVTRLASRPVPSTGASGGPGGASMAGGPAAAGGASSMGASTGSAGAGAGAGGGAAAAGAASGATAATGVGLPLTAAVIGMQAVRSGLERAGREATATTDAASTGGRGEQPTSGSTGGSRQATTATPNPSAEDTDGSQR